MPSNPTQTAVIPKFLVKLPITALNGLGIDLLAGKANKGQHGAATALAEILTSHPSREIQSRAARAIQALAFGPCLDEVWQVWATTRDQRLLTCLSEKKIPASQPASLAALSLLVLKSRSVYYANEHMVQALLSLLTDPDPQIVSAVIEVIRKLHLQTGITALCREWCETRSPQLLEIITSCQYTPEADPSVRTLIDLKIHLSDWLTTAKGEQIPALIAALKDADPEIRARAQYCLDNLRSPHAVEVFCRTWAGTRDAVLEDILTRSGYVARYSPEVRILSALKTDHIQIACQAAPSQLTALLNACTDGDPDIAARARDASLHLKRPDTRENICQMAITEEHLLARPICIEADYLPEKPSDRALYLFMTGQWDRYDQLDFDHRLLRMIYQAAADTTRRRIAATIQIAGRSDYLDILVPFSNLSHEVFSETDFEIFAGVLLENHEYQKAWELLDRLSLQQAGDLLRRIITTGWRPADGADRSDYGKIMDLLSQPLTISPVEILSACPPAIRRSILRVHGRVNDLAFSPIAPHLAIATGSRRVVVWDYQLGSVAETVKGSSHSIGQVAYARDGSLIFSQRSDNNSLCRIYLLTSGEIIPVGQHLGPVTVLIPFEDGQLFSAGRDGFHRVWTTGNGMVQPTLQREQQTFDWTRQAALSPDGTLLAVEQSRPDLLAFPSLQSSGIRLSTKGRHLDDSSWRTVFFTHSGDLLAGLRSGQVLRYAGVQDRRSYYSPQKLASHSAPVTGLHHLASVNTVISASSDGVIHFTDLNTKQSTADLHTPGNRLTSLHCSPDEMVLATGSDNAVFTLWDLRPILLPALLNKPIAHGTPADLALLIQMLSMPDEQLNEIPTGILNAARLMALLLHRRFRYDIHLGAPTGIQYGDFDILLE